MKKFLFNYCTEEPVKPIEPVDPPTPTNPIPDEGPDCS